MVTTESWWEAIFSGVLEIGLDKEKIKKLNDESFLYLKQDEPESEENVAT